VREARQLKEYVSNGEILKEKLHAEAARARRAEEALAAAGDTAAHVAALEAQLAHWQGFYKVGLLSFKTRSSSRGAVACDFMDAAPHSRHVVHVVKEVAARSEAQHVSSSPVCVRCRSRAWHILNLHRAMRTGRGAGAEAGGPAAHAASAAAGQHRPERAPRAGRRSSQHAQGCVQIGFVFELFQPTWEDTHERLM